MEVWMREELFSDFDEEEKKLHYSIDSSSLYLESQENKSTY